MADTANVKDDYLDHDVDVSLVCIVGVHDKDDVIDDHDVDDDKVVDDPIFVVGFVVVVANVAAYNFEFKVNIIFCFHTEFNYPS